MQLFHGNQLMELFHGIILWNHFVISKHRNTMEHEQYDLTAFFSFHDVLRKIGRNYYGVTKYSETK